MTLFELLFILLFLASILAVLGGLVLLATKRRRLARKALGSVAAVCAVYLAVVAVSDFFTHQRVTRAGDDRCFDEMCFAVVDAMRLQPAPAHSDDPLTYIVRVRVTSRSRGRPQAEGGLQARLYQGGRFFRTSGSAQAAYDAACGQTAKLTQRLAPGESVVSTLLFAVPREIAAPALTLDHGFTPGFFVIGESPFFHEPDVLQLPPDMGSRAGDLCPTYTAPQS